MRGVLLNRSSVVVRKKVWSVEKHEEIGCGFSKTEQTLRYEDTKRWPPKSMRLILTYASDSV